MLTWKLVPAIVWAIIILLLTGLPGTYFPTITSFWDWLSPDKVVHVIIFATQSFLVFWAYGKQYLHGSNRLVYTWLILLFITIFAMLTEVLQAYVFVGRNGNVYDFIADSAGVLAGLWIFRLYNKKIFIKHKVN